MGHHDFRRWFAWLGFVSACACQSAVKEDVRVARAPDAVRPKAPAPAASTSAPRPLPTAADATAVEDTTVGRFVPRLEIMPTTDDDFECVPFVSDLAGLANGEVWVVGSCGLRGRVTDKTFVDSAAPWQKKGRTYANRWYSCPAHASYFAAVARSPQDVYAVGDMRCGLDPNSIWFRAPEHFDGRTWRSLAYGERLMPEVLTAGATGAVYGLSGRSRDDVRAAPSCAIVQLGGGQARVFRRCRAPRLARDHLSGDVERFASIAVDGTGALWVSGERIAWKGAAEQSSPFLLRHDAGRWTEQPFDEVGELVRAASGELWLFGKSAWQEHQGSWRKVSLKADLRDASEICVRAPDDIWWLGPAHVWHFDGERTRAVHVDAPDERSSVMRLEMAGPRLYASSQFKVWQLAGPSESVPSAVTLHQGRAPAALR